MYSVPRFSLAVKVKPASNLVYGLSNYTLIILNNLSLGWRKFSIAFQRLPVLSDARIRPLSANVGMRRTMVTASSEVFHGHAIFLDYCLARKFRFSERSSRFCRRFYFT